MKDLIIGGLIFGGIIATINVVSELAVRKQTERTFMKFKNDIKEVKNDTNEVLINLDKIAVASGKINILKNEKDTK